MSKAKIKINELNPFALDVPSFEVAQKTSRKMAREMRTNTTIVPERTGMYKSGITSKSDKDNKTAVVFEDPSKKKPAKQRRLGHLLENGVASRNMEAQPHWIVYEDKYTKIFITDMEKVTQYIE